MENFDVLKTLLINRSNQAMKIDFYLDLHTILNWI